MTNQINMTAFEAATKIARSLSGHKVYAEIVRLDADITDEAFIGLEVSFANDGEVSGLIAEITTRYDNGYPANPLGVSFLDISKMSEDDLVAAIYEHIKARIAGERTLRAQDDQFDIAADLEHAVRNAEPVSGVTWQVERSEDRIVITAAYAEELGYTDEPWEALGTIPDGGRSGTHSDYRGTVFQWVQYDLDIEADEAPKAA